MSLLSDAAVARFSGAIRAWCIERQSTTRISLRNGRATRFLSATGAAGQARRVLGMLIDAGLIDPANPDRPAPGGLHGLIQEYLRNNPGAGR